MPRRIASFRAGLTAADGNQALATFPGAAERLEAASWIRACVVVPPNLYLDLQPAWLAAVLAEELTVERDFAFTPPAALSTAGISLAFCSPNANKPLHIGHARNMLLGTVTGNLLELSGARVYRSMCLSDYGVHIFKALSAYLRFGQEDTPESSGEKGDHFVGRFYSEFHARPELAEGPGSPQELSRLWMEGSREVEQLTRQLVSWAEAGFDRTFADWGVAFDHRFYETEEQAYIDAFLARESAAGTVRPDDQGRLVVELPGDPPEAVPLTRSDGSALYMSHMVAAILQRLDHFGDRVQLLMTLTGEEQVVPFMQLERILDRFGHRSRAALVHLTHGMVQVDGRSMASREGNAPTLDDCIEELGRRYEAEGFGPRAPARARQALTLYLLLRPREKPLAFSLERCLEVAEPVLEDVARTLRVTGAPLGDGKAFPSASVEARFERYLLKLATYPLLLGRAVDRLDPSPLAQFVSDLCSDFNGIYRACGSGRRGLPEMLSAMFAPTRSVLGHALDLLHVRRERRTPECAARLPVTGDSPRRPAPRLAAGTG